MTRSACGLRAWWIVITLLCAHPARAEDAEPVPEVSSYVAPQGILSGLQFHGYIDMGVAKAQGNGTSFSPNDARNPVDYGSDTFATAVNSRGDVASTNANGQFTNGFLPSSLNIGGHASAFISTVDLDVLYAPENTWYTAFIRMQLLPRFDSTNEDQTQILLEQAFIRVVPFDSQELSLTLGKFDGVFGIEYLENEAPVRTNITPSLIARYTTGQQLGGKVFYRAELPAIWSAVSLNVALTNNPPVVEALDPEAFSLSGIPVFTGRLGYELNHPQVQLKAGVSASVGPRGDQTNPSVLEQEFGVDLRFTWRWLSLSAEGVHVQEAAGGADKVGDARLVSAFLVNGYNAELAIGIPIPSTIIRKINVYVQYSQRFGGFTGFAFLDTCRVTPGFRIDVWGIAALKAEYLRNIEISGAPTVANDIITSSLVIYF